MLGSQRCLLAAGVGLFVVACGTEPKPSPIEVGQVRPALSSIAGWHTNGTKIYPPGETVTPFRIEGVNWYGFETRNYVAQGLWAANYVDIVDKIAAYGFNTIRIPFSNEMWELNPTAKNNIVGACQDCQGTSARNVLAMIINYAATKELKIILDNHRSSAGNSAEGNGLWYTDAYPEEMWIDHWQQVQAWVNGGKIDPDDELLTLLGQASVIGFDLRNEPHTAGHGRNPSYLNEGATWGTGDDLPVFHPNPDPFSPPCVAPPATCKDWRLAAERAGTTLLGDAVAHGWPLRLIIVEGIGRYPADGTTPVQNITDQGWWGGMLEGPRGNSTNPGAPIVLNNGWDSANGLGEAVYNQLVYSSHDYGPDLSGQPWFNGSTCYAAGCGSSSLVDVWYQEWAYLTDQINPVSSGAYPWANTGHVAYNAAPLLVGEFGTGNSSSDIVSTGNGSQGQWFNALVDFLEDSSDPISDNTGLGATGRAVNDLNFAYWSLNGNDDYALLNTDWDGPASAEKINALCEIQTGRPTTEATCDDGVDDDCDGDIDCEDADCSTAAECQVSCGDGQCSAGEDCNNCSADCCQSTCNDNGVCDAGEECSSCNDCCQSTCDDDGVCEAGENCNNCGGDCEGKTTGKPSDRFCCGNGDLESAEGDGSRCDGNY